MVEYTVGERRLVLLAACLAGFITPLLSTMMNLSLVAIGEEFSVGSHELAYVNTAYLLSSVIFMVPLSKLADIIGKRRMFVIGLLVTLAAVVLASLSPSFWWLIACRAMMGAGAAATTSISISLLTDVYPGSMRGLAIGLQSMCVYIGLASGPPIGGTLNDVIGWHALFLIVVPLAAGSLICISMFRHEVSPDEGEPFDSKGAVLYGSGLCLAMLGVINITEAWALPLLVVGIVLIGAFARWQTRIPNYLLNVRLFRSRVFAGSCIAAFLLYAASYSVSYFLALYLQSIGAMTATEAGLVMLVQAAVQAVCSVYFGRMSDRVRDKRVLPSAGAAITAVGVSLFLLYGTELDLPLVLATMFLVGFGLGMFASPNTSVIMGSVPKTETGEASAMVGVMRQTGMTVSMAIAMLFITLEMGSADDIVPANYGSFVDVIHMSFAVCLAMCIVGLIASLLRGSETRADV